MCGKPAIYTLGYHGRVALDNSPYHGSYMVYYIFFPTSADHNTTTLQNGGWNGSDNTNHKEKQAWNEGFGKVFNSVGKKN